eukprot:GHVU01223486.1.p1 GENE.GHVU01223486.1~~GHVU01223486.1.p1  ORF type:complete len:130 (+),score=28.23 GHVU01223486.1:473-862(+)
MPTPVVAGPMVPPELQEAFESDDLSIAAAAAAAAAARGGVSEAATVGAPPLLLRSVSARPAVSVGAPTGDDGSDEVEDDDGGRRHPRWPTTKLPLWQGSSKGGLATRVQRHAVYWPIVAAVQLETTLRY